MPAGVHKPRRMKLAQSVAIVTGASRGIGRETARALARQGARVVLAARQEHLLRGLEAELREEGADTLVVPTDVARQEDVERLVERTLEQWGRIDIIVANAGIILRRPIAQTTLSDFERVMAVNFYGVVRLVLGVLPLMVAQGSGHLVVVSSVDGKKGLPPEGVYVASKYAVTGFCDVLRQELRTSGVRVTTVLPARVETPMIARVKVPWVSAKIPATAAAQAIVRGIRRGRAEVVVPFLGPKALILAASFWAPLGDWLVRLFKLAGEERVP